MNKIISKFLLLVVLSFIITLLGCSGSVGNTNTDNYKEPQIEYRLIENNTAYEVVSLASNFFGAFAIEVTYKDPKSTRRALPVKSIADNAFANQGGIMGIVILANITHIGENAFEGWNQYQKIYFQVSENTIKKEPYSFDEKWNYGCNAKILWEVNIEELQTFIPPDKK